ncbi:hypothetical protein DXG01_008876 [Tephrocybe rancida]|nr:hypothetical protein DXG01_008876 [Tephrocybe rancida]
MNETDQAIWRVYRSLLSLIPQLEDFHSGASLIRISQLISRGVHDARLDDAEALRDKIFSWLFDAFGDDALGLEGMDKERRGFKHSLTGSLLCPVNLAWDDPQTREAIRSGAYKGQMWGWPSFVYAWGSEIDGNEDWNGLFRSPLLVAAYKHVFTSPSSLFAQMQLSSKTQPGDRCIYGMTHVTPRSIAYIAMHVRFALGSERLLTLEDAFRISSRKFYELTIDFFDKFSNNIEMHELLLWWDKQVFPATETSEE